MFLDMKLAFILKRKEARIIPRIIHYVWVGEQKMDVNDIEQYLSTWVKYNPDYKIMIWDNKRLDFSIPYIKNAYKLKKWANISNYIRFYALLNYGGIYLDTDIFLLKSLNKLLKNNCFFGFQLKSHPTHWVNNAVMGSIKGHWFIKKSLKFLLNNFDGSESADQSSPVLITKLLKNEGLKKYSEKGVFVKDIKIFPKEYFYPFFYNEKFLKKYIKSKTIAVHLWEKRWV